MSEPKPFTVRTTDGAVLHASREGSGPALVLVSGLAGTASFWAQTAAALARQCEVIRLDQRGIGASSRGDAPCDIAQLARDVLAVLDEAGVERCALLGHSAGGCIGQSLAAQAPDRLSSLILSATCLKPSRYMRGMFETRRAILQSDAENYASIGALLAFPPRWLEANWQHYDNALAAAPATSEAKRIMTERIDALLAFDGAEAVAAVDALPCLILGAADDMIVPGFHQKELAGMLPHAQLIMLESGGHFFPVSRPDSFTSTVANWLLTAR